MKAIEARDRLQPSLLDRLIDPEPGSRQEAPEARVLTRQQLRAAVLRDLAWLFNAVRLQADPPGEHRASATDWEYAREAQRSVLNFGLPALTGMTLSRAESEAIQRGIVEAIRNFEPRIEGESLEVRVGLGRGQHHNVLQIQIRGRLWSQPVPLELLLAADLDVETGTARVRDLRA